MAYRSLRSNIDTHFGIVYIFHKRTQLSFYLILLYGQKMRHTTENPTQSMGISGQKALQAYFVCNIARKHYDNIEPAGIEQPQLLMPKGIPNRQYMPEFKEEVIKTMREEQLDYRETAERFGILHRRVMD